MMKKGMAIKGKESIPPKTRVGRMWKGRVSLRTR